MGSRVHAKHRAKLRHVVGVSVSVVCECGVKDSGPCDVTCLPVQPLVYTCLDLPVSGRAVCTALCVSVCPFSHPTQRLLSERLLPERTAHLERQE
jgi:hypothetical protein